MSIRHEKQITLEDSWLTKANPRPQGDRGLDSLGLLVLLTHQELDVGHDIACEGGG